MGIEIIESLQSITSSFVSSAVTIFNLLGQIPFFIVVFGIIYWCFDSNYAMRFCLSYGFTWIFCIGAKNIFNTNRPYQDSSEIFANRDALFGGMPSLHTSLVGSMAGFVFPFALKKPKNNATKILLFLLLVFCCFAIGFAELYLGQVYLIDAIVGLILGLVIGVIFSCFVKKIDFNKALTTFLLVTVSLIFVFIPFNQLLGDDLSNKQFLLFSGMMVSIFLGNYLQSKYVKFETNYCSKLFFVFKMLFGSLLSVLLYCGLEYIMPEILILQFLITFIDGIFVTLVLPMFFKIFAKVMFLDQNRE